MSAIAAEVPKPTLLLRRPAAVRPSNTSAASKTPARVVLKKPACAHPNVNYKVPVLSRAMFNATTRKNLASIVYHGSRSAAKKAGLSVAGQNEFGRKCYNKLSVQWDKLEASA